MSSSSGDAKSPVTSVTNLLAGLLLVGGASGLLRELFGWIQFLGFLRYLIPDGWEVFGYVLMMVAGLAVGVAGDHFAKQQKERAGEKEEG
ncbi:hypothetical protein ACIRBX_04965 [Kitasatospora sp. NPDC096147]|uniref:hypothetical protein n=1 Tax=Kitasatospora sp. NPDC096147 TaxID=3364093 RepID=UPI0037F469C8